MAAVELHNANAICSAECIAEVLGLTGRHVRRLTRAGVLPLVRRNGKHPRYRLDESVQRYLKHQKDYTIAELSRPDDAYQVARARRMDALAEREELTLKLRKGELHDARDVEFCMTQIMTNFRQQILALPSRVARLCVGKTFREILEILTTEIHSVLRTLSGYDPAMFAEQRAAYLSAKSVDMNGEAETDDA